MLSKVIINLIPRERMAREDHRFRADLKSGFFTLSGELFDIRILLLIEYLPKPVHLTVRQVRLIIHHIGMFICNLCSCLSDLLNGLTRKSRANALSLRSAEAK